MKIESRNLGLSLLPVGILYVLVTLFAINALLIREGIAAESCSGTTVEISDRTFDVGETATCIATTSIDIGSMVLVSSDAYVCLRAPSITFNPPFQIAYGATLSAGPTGCGRLNDTGITWGGDYPSGNNTTCTSNITGTQDCHHGRDDTHNDDIDGHAGFSFTKISSTGLELPSSAINWECVRDNVTGLMWEVKTNDGGIHDRYNTYRWGGKTHLGTGYGTYYDDWDTLVDGSNTASLCGFNDWRVPNVKELQGLVDFNQTGQVTDINFFPNTEVDYYWSTSPNAFDSNNAWSVNFHRGYTYYKVARGDSGSVRLVRGGQ